MSLASAAYERLPVWAQHGAVTAYGLYWYVLRFGPGFRRLAAGYRARERFSEDEWRAWERERLTTILGWAVERVPYYRDFYSAEQKQAAREGRLSGLPLLEKDPLRRDPYAFVRDDRPRPPLAFPTSGSTGTPIMTLWTRQELRDSMAVREVRSAGWAGVSFRQPRATFSGRMVEPRADSTGPFYRFNAVEGQVYLSPFHLRPETASQYVNALRRHRVRWLTGYAVSYYLLGQFMLDQNLSTPDVRAIITTSEKLTAPMRDVMTRAYGCPVYEEYSTVDNAIFASECEYGSLHVSPDVSVVEILRGDGTPCDPGEPGEVVTTSLMHESQILIRARIGDIAAYSADPCVCGRAMPVLKEVVGRIEDVVIGPDGRRLVRFHGVFTDGVRIVQGQIVQEALDRIRVRVVPAAGYGEADDRELARRVRARMGATVHVDIEKVDRLAPAGSGKVPAVISQLRGAGIAAAERTGLDHSA